MLSSLLTIAVLVSAQATTSDPAADPAVSDPVATAPAATSTTTTPAPAATPAADPTTAEPSGWGTAPTAAAQCGAGLGGCCVGACVAAPCSLIPFGGVIATPLIAGAAIGASETVVGDAVGQKRGSLLLPVLSSVGILAAGAAGALGASFALGLGTTALDPNALSNPATVGTLFIPSAIQLTSFVAAGIAPVVIYQFTAVDKEPGDEGGFGMPGIMEPADPTGTRAEKARGATAKPAPSPAGTPPAPAGTPTPGLSY